MNSSELTTLSPSRLTPTRTYHLPQCTCKITLIALGALLILVGISLGIAGLASAALQMKRCVALPLLIGGSVLGSFLLYLDIVKKENDNDPQEISNTHIMKIEKVIDALCEAITQGKPCPESTVIPDHYRPSQSSGSKSFDITLENHNEVLNEIKQLANELSLQGRLSILQIEHKAGESDHPTSYIVTLVPLSYYNANESNE